MIDSKTLAIIRLRVIKNFSPSIAHNNQVPNKYTRTNNEIDRERIGRKQVCTNMRICACEYKRKT